MTSINEVYKNLGTTLEISSAHQGSIDLEGSFSTQDVKTARLIFKLTKDGSDMPLSALDAHIYLTSPTLKSESKALINKDESTVSYILTDEEIKHYGPVQAELYLRYTNGQTLSVHKFHFTIDQALIDQDMEIIEHVYNASIEELMNEYRDTFDNLEVELNRQLEEVKTELNQTQTLSETTRQEVESYKALLEANLALKKTGDTATGTINNTAESAYTVSYGYLRHYIGAQPTGTVVRMYIGYTGHWGSYVDIVVGETSIVSNGDFFMNPITPSTTYATGVAPLDVTRSKSVINSVEKTASNTTNMKSALEFGRSGEKGWVKGDTEINGTLSFDIGKINPAIFYDASNITDTQSWARGIGARAGDRLSEFGISGVGKTVNSMYMGFGASPWLKANGLFIDNRSKIMSLFGIDIETVLGSQAKIDAFKKSMNTTTVALTLKNGFTAQNNSTVGYLAIPLGNRYLVWLKGWVTAATGVLATMPTAFLPDETYQTAFPGAQQSSSAANQSNLYLNPTNGNVEVVAIGSTTAAVSLASIIYITKEVAV
ncbi:BppU family phage baseplate upper protein [Listeria newyorkensis]|uniref:BppU family phage baseplate upper protein n=1 Tax=Listeria newyorkensis TaxID=1497681 RepID=A0A841Z0V4_9LIST|nr:BppU family phage baseplate upper protein [Listeria newyorkensis]MBC1458483.1 BppU family phage baseplate upper protein [Listeria newyorkensis]